MDLLEITNIMRTIESVKPDEIYNLGSQSFVGTSFDQPALICEVNGMGVLRLLEAIRIVKPDIKFYQASTSEMFGKAVEVPQTETTPFYPRNPYGIAKVFGHLCAVNYRETYNMFICSGILYNHESPLRGIEFVTRKITRGVASIKYGLQDRLILGDLEAKRDWGYAKEYVKGMWMMLQNEKPDTYVLATGKTHSVKEFAEHAFKYAGYDIVWEGQEVNEKGIDRKTGKTLVEVSPEFYRSAEINLLVGNPGKAKEVLGWEANIKFEELVEIMMEEDMRKRKNEKISHSI
jgi:GDPmannose 4,6-dehydratase